MSVTCQFRKQDPKTSIKLLRHGKLKIKVIRLNIIVLAEYLYQYKDNHQYKIDHIRITHMFKLYTR